MIMRKVVAILALLAAGTAAIAGDYPWCLKGGDLGYSGDCSYWAQGQCLASASGRWILHCDVNRRLLFERQQACSSRVCRSLACSRVAGTTGITEVGPGAICDSIDLSRKRIAFGLRWGDRDMSNPTAVACTA
jgi:hypothetical protein